MANGRLPVVPIFLRDASSVWMRCVVAMRPSEDSILNHGRRSIPCRWLPSMMTLTSWSKRMPTKTEKTKAFFSGRRSLATTGKSQKPRRRLRNHWVCLRDCANCLDSLVSGMILARLTQLSKARSVVMIGPTGSIWHKAPPNVWLRPYGTYRFADDSDTRPAFRHELASALALFAVLARYAPLHDALLGPWSEAFAAMGMPLAKGVDEAATPTAIEQAVLDCSAEDFDLLAYLVASHHGKVRIGLHAAPSDQDYDDRDRRGLPIRGVRDGDRLPAVATDPDSCPLPELTLMLAPATLGLSKRTGASWYERCQELLERYGPASLAYMETLLRVADVRASRMITPDLTLQKEASI